MKNRKWFRMSVLQWVAVAVLGSSAALSLAVTLPNTFSAGGPAVADQVNANFSELNNALEARTGAGNVSVSGLVFIDFSDESNLCNMIRFFYARYHGTSNFCTSFAPLSLPNGATLTGLFCTARDVLTGPNQSVTISLNRVRLSDGVNEYVISTPPTTDAAIQIVSATIPLGGTATVDNGQFAYYLTSDFNAGASNFSAVGESLGLYGCRVSYSW